MAGVVRQVVVCSCIVCGVCKCQFVARRGGHCQCAVWPAVSAASPGLSLCPGFPACLSQTLVFDDGVTPGGRRNDPWAQRYDS